MSKFEVTLVVQTIETYIVNADNKDAAVDVARERFRNGEDSDIPCCGDADITDFTVEPFGEPK